MRNQRSVFFAVDAGSGGGVFRETHMSDSCRQMGTRVLFQKNANLYSAIVKITFAKKNGNGDLCLGPHFRMGPDFQGVFPGKKRDVK